MTLSEGEASTIAMERELFLWKRKKRRKRQCSIIMRLLC